MNIAQEFESLFDAIRGLQFDPASAQAALVTITRTHGSTFRRVGASMLVHRDARLVCELSGGCPQRDIVLRAMHSMESGTNALVSYGRESNFDVMIETGCGGELDVLIEPWFHAGDVAFMHVLGDLHARRDAGVMASIFTRSGVLIDTQLPRYIKSDTVQWSNVDNSAFEKCIAENVAAHNREITAPVSWRMESSGHTYDALVESIAPALALVVVGDGIGASMLARLSRDLGWQTTHLRTRPADTAPSTDSASVFASPQMLPSMIPKDARTSVVIMTHRLELDMAYVEALLPSPVRYIGVIGSRQRSEQLRARFSHDDRLHAPAGLDVGSETPMEIALAIAAEILAHRNGRLGGSLLHSKVPIHP